MINDLEFFKTFLNFFKNDLWDKGYFSKHKGFIHIMFTDGFKYNLLRELHFILYNMSEKSVNEFFYDYPEIKNPIAFVKELQKIVELKKEKYSIKYGEYDAMDFMFLGDFFEFSFFQTFNLEDIELVMSFSNGHFLVEKRMLKKEVKFLLDNFDYPNIRNLMWHFGRRFSLENTIFLLEYMYEHIDLTD